jgi:hypothetical protein
MAKEEKRKRNPEFTTDKGKFRFPKLNDIDFGTEKFPKPAGEFSVQLVLPEGHAYIEKFNTQIAELVEQAEEMGKEGFEKLKPAMKKKFKEPTLNENFSPVLDKDTNEETGEVVIKFKMAASGESKKDGKKWIARPAVFDAKGKPIALFVNAPGKANHGKGLAAAPKIWGGTVGKVAFEAFPYWNASSATYGVATRLKAVQIIDLVSQGSRSASGYGFGEEDGYSAEAQHDAAVEDEDGTATEAEAGETASSDDDDDGNF